MRVMNKRPKINALLSLFAFIILFIGLSVLEAKQKEYQMLYSVLQKGAIFAIAASSMNLLNGFTGLFSLGQAGFMAVGAYVTAILTIPPEKLNNVYYMNGIMPEILSFRKWMSLTPQFVQSLYPYLALIIAGSMAALFAAFIGIPVLRLKSDYLAIATLGFSEIIRALIASPQLDQVTNGSYGLKSIPRFNSIIVVFAIMIVCVGFIVMLIRSSYGRAFKAIREDEVAAEAMGINLFRHKEMSFVTSSFFTAISGGMLAMYMRSIDSSTFKIAMTYDVLLIVVIGGIGSITGSVLGAFLITFAKEWWLRFFDEPQVIFGLKIPLLRSGFRMVVFSALLMIVVLFYRKGLLGSKEFTWELFMPRYWNRRRQMKKGTL